MSSYTGQLLKSSIWSDEFYVRRDELLCREGERDQNLYWIEEGCVRVYMLAENQERTIRFGYQNNVIVALDSFITDEPTRFNIAALRKTRVRKASKQSFDRWRDEENWRGLEWGKMMEGLVYQQLEREIDLLTDSPTDRLQRVLKRSPQLFQEVPHKYIASYLRMTPETLSRILNS